MHYTSFLIADVLERTPAVPDQLGGEQIFSRPVNVEAYSEQALHTDLSRFAGIWVEHYRRRLNYELTFHLPTTRHAQTSCQMMLVRGVWVAHCLFQLFGPIYYKRLFYFTMVGMICRPWHRCARHSGRAQSQIEIGSTNFTTGFIWGSMRAVLGIRIGHILFNHWKVILWLIVRCWASGSSITWTDQWTYNFVLIIYIGVIQSDIASTVCGVSL